jgi:hypothetical protein
MQSGPGGGGGPIYPNRCRWPEPWRPAPGSRAGHAGETRPLPADRDLLVDGAFPAASARQVFCGSLAAFLRPLPGGGGRHVAPQRLCGWLENRQGYWRRSGFGKKYFIINAWYAVNVVLILALTLTLDNFHLVGYFGGDPESSFGRLYLPSVLILSCAHRSKKSS